MSVNERVRLEALGRVKRGELTVVAAAELMGLSLRQGRVGCGSGSRQAGRRGSGASVAGSVEQSAG